MSNVNAPPQSPHIPDSTVPNAVGEGSGPVREISAEPLAPPGMLGRIDDDEYRKLMDAVDEHHAQPPNPQGKTGPPVEMADGSRFWGPKHVPGHLRTSVAKKFLCRTYLEEGIFQLHVMGRHVPGKTTNGRKRLSLPETASQLGYSYAHVVQVFRAMKRRAFDAEGATDVTGGVREFLNHHLEQAIEVASQRLDDNAAYGAVLIRAVEAFKELNGLDSSEDRNLNVEELAERVRGRSPLLLEVVRHSADAKKRTDQAAGDGD